MQIDAVLRQLEKAGTAQNRKVYARHGVGAKMYGVSYADLKVLAKRIGTDHPLAQALWETGNHDARILATMVADANAASAKELDAWVRDLDCYSLADALSAFVVGSRSARDRAQAWKNAGGEWIESAGWGIVARLAAVLPEGELANDLTTIERDIHRRANRVRYTMNSALIAIGGRSPELRAQALAAAKRIGKVEVDHGETGCKTPEAAAYIEKVAAYAATRVSRAAAGKRSGAAPGRRR